MMAFDAAALGIVLPGAMTGFEKWMWWRIKSGRGAILFRRNWPGAVGGVDMIGEIEADFDDFPLPLDAVVMWYD